MTYADPKCIRRHTVKFMVNDYELEEIKRHNDSLKEEPQAWLRNHTLAAIRARKQRENVHQMPLRRASDVGIRHSIGN